MHPQPQTMDTEEKQNSPTTTNDTVLQQHPRDASSAFSPHESALEAQSLASIDRPPGSECKLPAAKIYHPFSLPVLALLMPASILGVLARLGLQALVTYDGQSVFPLAYVQATGCFIMGIGLGIKDPLGRLCVALLAIFQLKTPPLTSHYSYGPLYTAMTTGD